jgi:AcrR family transcriptional regulator
MPTTRLPTHDRQAELVDAALRIIATRGIAALTTRELAAEVGLSSGAIFKHFASLQDLLEAVVARVEEVLDSTYPARDLPPAVRLAQFVEARSTAVGRQLGILRLVLSDQFHLALPKGGSTRLARCVQRTRTFIVECLQEAQRTGDIRTDLAAEALAPIVMGTVQMLALSSKSARARDEEAAIVLSSLLALLRAESPQAPPQRSLQ